MVHNRDAARIAVRLLLAVVAALSLAVGVVQPAIAVGVDPSVVGDSLGGSWTREGQHRSFYAFRGSMRPAGCSPGRYTQPRKGRAYFYSGPYERRWGRSARVHVLRYGSSASSRKGLVGLKRFFKDCPGPVTDGCTGCDPADDYYRGLPGARIGRGSFGWWTGSLGNVTAYSTSIAFTDRNELIVVDYMLMLRRYRPLDRSFIVNVPKVKSLARAVKAWR